MATQAVKRQHLFQRLKAATTLSGDCNEEKCRKFYKNLNLQRKSTDLQKKTFKNYTYGAANFGSERFPTATKKQRHRWRQVFPATMATLSGKGGCNK